MNDPIRPMPKPHSWPPGMLGKPPSLEGVKPGGPAIDPITGFDYTPPKREPKRKRLEGAA